MRVKHLLGGWYWVLLYPFGDESTNFFSNSIYKVGVNEGILE